MNGYSFNCSILENKESHCYDKIRSISGMWVIIESLFPIPPHR